jgi:hypothetical protein
MNNEIDFQLIEYPAGWKSIADAWLTLFQQCSRPCMFYHPFFIEAAEVFPAHITPTHVVAGYQDDVLVFGVPIRLKDYWGVLKKVNFFEGVYFAHLAPLDSTPGFTATQSFFAYINDHYRPAEIQARPLENEYTKILLENNCVKKQFKISSNSAWRYPVFSLPGNQEELMNNFTLKFRHNIRNSLRRAEDAKIEMRILTSSLQGYTFADAYENLLKLIVARCKSMDRDSTLVTEITAPYYKVIFKLCDKLDDFLMFAEALHQGEVIGSAWGILAKDRFYAMQIGFSPQYAELGIGNLLIYRVMLALIDKKVPIFDFLQGEDPYKLKWTRTIETDFDVIMRTTSFLSRAVFTAQTLARKSVWLKNRLLGKD